jgi:3-oxoacyl-[acyl-carrier-protein] synthase III
LQEARLLEEEVGALLVTSEAPPLLSGLAAAVHHRLGLRPQTPALEVGGACTGFLAAL